VRKEKRTGAGAPMRFVNQTDEPLSSSAWR
jgi:hypothetical protein